MGCDNGGAIKESNEKPNVIFVIGGPGCGKGTQCKKIVENFKYESFSTGDLLRNYVKEKKDGYEDIQKLMTEGKLISSETLMKVLKTYVVNCPNKKILIDGYPRNQENIDVWEKEMGDLVNVKAALYIEVSNEEMKKRLLGRNEGRADDNEKTILKRIDVFDKETRPLAPTFEKQGILVRIDCNRTKEEIFEDIKKKLVELKLA